MADQNQQQDEVRQLVEQAVAQAFQAQIPPLQTQIVRQVLRSLPAPASAPPASGAGDSSALVHAVSPRGEMIAVVRIEVHRVLVFAAVTAGTTAQGLGLMVAYCLGLGLPFVALAFAAAASTDAVADSIF